MLSDKDTRIAQRLKRRLLEATEIINFVVYGSRARGLATPESDMDVFIEVPILTPELRKRISELAWEVGFDEDVVISTFVATPEAIQEGPLGANPLLRAVELEGVKI